ncbi:MAG: thioredoxin domain-containing protein [Hydrogenovibrio sp.]
MTAIAANSTAASPLNDHPSPYLAMHSDDPVHWQEWQPSVLTTAAAENKLIFLSSGYFACHWCHVMQQENYQNPEIAAYLNRHFINVKIDRELTPDLDRYMIAFAEKAAGHAGWPQHVILTPNGKPFFAFVYQPTDQLRQTLHRVQQLWQTDPQRILQAAQSGLTQPTPPEEAPKFTLNAQTFYRLFHSALQSQMDDFSGGLKGSLKFPKAPILLATLNSEPDDTLQAWLKLTLDQMQSQHLFDHIHGGFYRYTVDPEWQTPHFEKMLYTQAQLAQVYFKAAEAFERPDYAETAQQTLAYAEQHLWHPETSLFRGSQSALDQNGDDGGAYLWSAAELRSLLTHEQYHEIHQAWSLSASPPYALGWHPKPTQQHWPQIRKRLQAATDDIPTDDKSLLGWNGLMLSAYAAAMQQNPQASQRWQQYAQPLARTLIKWLQQTHPPTALSRDNQPIGRANLQDFAYVIQGLNDWQRVQPAPGRPDEIRLLQAQAEHRFLDGNGWHLSDAPLLPGQMGQWAFPEDALPSPTARLERQPSRLAKTQAQLSAKPLDFASYGQTLTALESASNPPPSARLPQAPHRHTAPVTEKGKADLWDF